jgi:hypothetical protein
MLTIMIILACGGNATDDKAAEDLGAAVAGWTGGDFDFQTISVKDQCLGGAFEALFMPDGPDTPHTFEHPVFIPSYGDLPQSYTIDFRAPFIEMPVTVDATDGQTYTIRGAVMEAVELGSYAYGDCVATMSVDADFSPVDANTATGDATISISNPRGEAGLCPVFDSDDCVVKLGTQAIRR